MQISNPFRMNDWPIKRLLIFVLAFQLATCGVFGLEAIGVRIPLLRQIILLIYLLYIPGILVLKSLRIHLNNSIETLFYAICISFAILMFTGVTANVMYPALGISDPISRNPLLVTYAIIISLLTFFCFFRDRYYYSDSPKLKINFILSPPTLILFLIPLLTVIGLSLVNEQGSNILIMVVFTAISIITVLIGFNKYFHKNVYPWAVFCIALSLFFSRSLISDFITGFDIHEEYYLANSVILHGRWDPTIASNYNAMLSVTMFGPISSIMTGISLTWIFKIIYPLLFSLAMPALFRIFQKQTNDKLAFLSCVFFMAQFFFYTDLPVILRQQIGTVFLVASILVMIDKGLTKSAKIALPLIFGASLVVSHYGLSYIYILFIVGVWAILVLNSNNVIKKWPNQCYIWINHFSDTKLTSRSKDLSGSANNINLTLIFFFVVIAFAWYMSVSGATIFISYTKIGHNVILNIAELFNPASSDSIRAVLSRPKTGLFTQIDHATNVFNQLLIVAGFMVMVLKYRTSKLDKHFIALSLMSLVLIFLGIVLPFYGFYNDMSRIYNIALTFLSLSAVLGGVVILEKAILLLRKVGILKTIAVSSMGLFSIYLTIFFLNQSGFIDQITLKDSKSLVLSGNAMKQGTIAEKSGYYNAILTNEDVASAKWIKKAMTENSKIYAIFNDVRVHSLVSYGAISVNAVSPVTSFNDVPQNSYVYLQKVNVHENIGTKLINGLTPGTQTKYFKLSEISYLFENKSKIYSNGGSEIYRS